MNMLSFEGLFSVDGQYTQMVTFAHVEFEYVKFNNHIRNKYQYLNIIDWA